MYSRSSTIANNAQRTDDNSVPLYLLDDNGDKSFRCRNFKNRFIYRENVEDSLHRALKPVILLARCLALFPVLGLNSENAKGLHFRWFSKPMLFSFIILCYIVLTIVLTTLRTIQKGFSYYNTVEFVFLVSLTFIYLLFIQMAIKWPEFACEWERTEKQMDAFGCTPHLAEKLRRLTFTIMTFALVEHISAVATNVVDALLCTTSDSGLVKAYFINSYKHIFSFVDYSPVTAITAALITIIMSCAWNFMDVFIIILSSAMTDRYKQFNRLLQSVNKKIMPDTFWRTMRETYNELSYLTKMMDELLSPIVLLSFANNLYFICLQLLNSLKPMASTWHAIYFVYSFSYLVLRTIAVSLFAAAIYDQSKQPKSVLFSVPAESYCVEVARLLTQVTSDDLALTGCRFFSITRTLVLTVAGTIVTYEIVLVQFNAVSVDVKKNETVTCVYY